MKRHMLRGSGLALLLFVGVPALVVVPSHIRSDEPSPGSDQRKPLEVQTVNSKAGLYQMTVAESEKMDTVHPPAAGLLPHHPPFTPPPKSAEPYAGMTEAEQAKLARAFHTAWPAADLQKRSSEPYIDGESRPAGAEGLTQAERNKLERARNANQ